tara:strand:+ start:321 stop:713 length:393 start_codon:yes stop_codon:yes gene_type:complete
MKKVSFEEWKKHYVDVPFIKENFDLLESMDVGIEFIECSQDVLITKYIRVFTFGSWYEILENGDHYFHHPYLGIDEYDYIGNDEKEIEKNLKDLYGFVIKNNIKKNHVEFIDIEDITEESCKKLRVPGVS